MYLADFEAIHPPSKGCQMTPEQSAQMIARAKENFELYGCACGMCGLSDDEIDALRDLDEDLKLL